MFTLVVKAGIHRGDTVRCVCSLVNCAWLIITVPSAKMGGSSMPIGVSKSVLGEPMLISIGNVFHVLKLILIAPVAQEGLNLNVYNVRATCMSLGVHVAIVRKHSFTTLKGNVRTV